MFIVFCFSFFCFCRQLARRVLFRPITLSCQLEAQSESLEMFSEKLELELEKPRKNRVCRYLQMSRPNRLFSVSLGQQRQKAIGHAVRSLFRSHDSAGAVRQVGGSPKSDAPYRNLPATEFGSASSALRSGGSRQ
jgi:hypothetical protein